MCGRRKRIIGRTSVLNERAGQLKKAVHCDVTRQSEIHYHGQNHRRFGTKTENVRITFGVLWCSNALNIQFHYNSFIKKFIEV